MLSNPSKCYSSMLAILYLTPNGYEILDHDLKLSFLYENANFLRYVRSGTVFLPFSNIPFFDIETTKL